MTLLPALYPGREMVLTGRGCTALWLYLRARGWREQGIVVPAAICPVVPYTILLSGNRPVYADVDADGLMTAATAAAVSGPAAALVVVHAYGQAADYAGLAAVAARRGWEVVEDAAAALGGVYADGVPLGGKADTAFGSFGDGKQLALGGGGFLVLRDAGLAGRVRELATSLPVFSREAADAALAGYQELVAAQPAATYWDTAQQRTAMASLCHHADVTVLADRLAAALSALPELLAQRRANAAMLDRAAAHPRLRRMRVAAGDAYWRFNVYADGCRDALLARLRARGIKATAYFAGAAALTGEDSAFPGATRHGASVINLWPGPETGTDDAAALHAAIDEFFAEREA